MEQNKKRKAAIIGVMNYLKEEEELRQSLTADQPTREVGNWTNYGRQLIMINRNQMQRRIVKR